MQLNSPTAGNCHCIRTAGRWRLNPRDPPAIGTSDRGYAVRTDGYANGVTAIGPAPDRIGFATLQHHVVAEDRADEWPAFGTCRWNCLTRRRLRQCACRGNGQQCGESGCEAYVPANHGFEPPVNIVCHWHRKLRASSGSPLPVYCACFGNAHSGRLRPGNERPVARTNSGAAPFSTQSTTAVSMSKWSREGPPPQWPIPGTRNIRLHSATVPAPPFA